MKSSIMYSIENDQLKVGIETLGAEIQSIFGKAFQLEYLWNGDPAFWSKRSPVLFPIVGTLKGNTYIYQGKTYQLGRHGFARDMAFEVIHQEPDNIVFFLKSNETTLEHYPFFFGFEVKYSLHGNDIRVEYEVQNRSSGEMYFSVGGHPAFKLPLVAGTSYDDYFLEFNEDEVKPRWPISTEGLMEKYSVPLLQGSNTLPLSKNIFLHDALVLKYLTSSIVSIRSEKTSRGIDVQLSDFPFVGIWAARDADFICIEPWCGIADSVDSDQHLIHKEGINLLGPGQVFTRSWTASFY